MALFIIDRNLAEQLNLTQAGVQAVKAMDEAAKETRWLFSLLPADKKNLYCLCEAPNLEAIVKAAETAGLPTDVVTGMVIEVRERFT